MKVILFGTSGQIAYVYEILRRNHDEVVQIVYPENRQHAKKVQQLRLFGQEKHILTSMQPLKNHVEAFCNQIHQLKPDIGIVWSYSQIIPKCIIEQFPHGLINYHGAYLPKYRGANVLNWVLVNGETETGVTLHYIDEGIDTGDIIAQTKVPITETDDANTLVMKLNETAVRLLEENWPGIAAGTIRAVPQCQLHATYCKKRTWQDGEIEWGKSAIEIYNLIRALVRPFPGAFFRTSHYVYTVWKATVCDDYKPDALCGQIVGIDGRQGAILVNTGKGMIRLTEIECEGQRIYPEQHFHLGEVFLTTERK